MKRTGAVLLSMLSTCCLTWEKHLLQFLHWWDQIIMHHKRKETPVLYICPEFGPAPYMPAMPFTQKPLSDQWEVNCWMMNVLRERPRRCRSSPQ
jgi:hypothetical protein